MSRFRRAFLFWTKCFVKLSNNVRAEVSSTVELGCIIYKAPSHQLTSALNLFLFIILWIKTQETSQWCFDLRLLVMSFLPEQELFCMQLPTISDCHPTKQKTTHLLNKKHLQRASTAGVAILCITITSRLERGVEIGTNLFIYRHLWGNRSVWSEAIR